MQKLRFDSMEETGMIHGYESNHFSIRMCKYFSDPLQAACQWILPGYLFSVLYV